jgi:cytidylate kinase
VAQTITISSSFGAGGNIVGPEVARQLGLPFFDRAITAAVAGRLAMPLEEADEQDEKAPSGWARVARAFANMAVPMAPQNLGVQDDPEHFRAETERILREIAATTGGVVLGRGAMVVLRDREDVLRVRLDGDIDARVSRVAELQQLKLDEVRAMQRDTDGARDRYLRLFYKVRQDDHSLYDLMIDSISIPLETCATLIVAAAAAKGAG